MIILLKPNSEIYELLSKTKLTLISTVSSEHGSNVGDVVGTLVTGAGVGRGVTGAGVVGAGVTGDGVVGAGVVVTSGQYASRLHRAVPISLQIY